MPHGTLPHTGPAPDQLVELNRLHQQGRYLDAFRLCENLAPLAQWQGAPALVLAGRLAQRWGDSPLSNRLHHQAYRADPTDWFARYYHVYTRWARHGTFEALRLTAEGVRSLPLVPETREQAYFWLLHARLLAGFRDFAAAEPILARTRDLFAQDPWIWVDQAEFLETQDRYDDALAAIEQGLTLQPWYVPAVQTRAHLLQLKGCDDEALALLQGALGHAQSGNIAKMIVHLLEEAGRVEEIPPLLDLAERYLPMPDRTDRCWLAARRCMTAYRSGDIVRAHEWAKKAAPDSPYYRLIAERLGAASEAPKRVHLPVGFVRQHHATCAPATLTALSIFWGVPADHLEIARRICYDGSPGYLERDWAETSGWHVREFRLTWDVARALLDRGCPFSVVTVEAENAHMQGVIGYDDRLQTLLVRDPYLRQFREWLAPEFFKAYAAHGPRSLILLPAGEVARLEGIELPDAALYDQLHLLRIALHRHQHPQAEAALAELQRVAPDHLLAHWAALDLAQYDGQFAGALASVQAIRRLFPEDANWRLMELRLHERLGDRIQAHQLLQEFGARRDAPGVFRREYAENLARDARNADRAGRALAGLLRRQSHDARTLRAYANWLWDQQHREAATQVYRLAASQADKTEYHWDSYFIACRHLGQADEALGLLRSRVVRWGQRSSLPARTLFDSLNAMDLTPEAFAVLDTQRCLRPDDGDFLLFSADAFTRFGRYAEAEEQLANAASRESRANWLRTAAKIADYRREHRAALAHWQELTQFSPTDHNIHAAIARLLATTEGDAAAVAHLEQACTRHPHLYPLHQTLVTRLRNSPATHALSAIDRMLALDPADPWPWREKALTLRRLQRFEEGLACADHAVQIAPHAPASHGVRAELLVSLGRNADAHAAYAAGIRLSIDADWLFSPLVDTAADFAARGAAVRFLQEELLRQQSLENAVLQFRNVARSIVSAAELAEMLRAYHRARPDEWSAWSALALHCLETETIPEALTLAESATARFPLVPRAWIDLARVQEKQRRPADEIASIEKALAINPAWSHASRQLSAAYERQLQLDRSEHVLRRAIAAEPNDATNHTWLADVLWRLRRPEEAIAEIEIALSRDPNLSWAWDRLHDWGKLQDDPHRAERLAVQLTETRAGETNSWQQLVRLRFNESDLTANLAALDRAAVLVPFDPEPWDLRAQLLVRHRRYDEALAACCPPALGTPPPWNLQGRAAWIEGSRGRYDVAIEQMSALVVQHPDYRWGWSRLTEWYWEKKQHADVQRCAEKWAWFEPTTAVPHGYLALVHLDANRRSEAKAALTKAIVIDPLYHFGAAELLKLHLQDSEFDAARHVLKHYETNYPLAESLRAQLRLHLAVKDRIAATQTLRQLGLVRGSATEPLQQAVGQLLEAGWYSVVTEALEPLLTDPAARAEAGEHWIATRRKQGQLWRTFWRLLWLRPTPTQRNSLLGGVICWLGEEKAVYRLWLARQIWKNPLHADTICWGQTGYALITASRHRAGVRWLRGWAERQPAPQGWMLHNLVIAHYVLGQQERARIVLDAALKAPADHVYDNLLIWRAVEHALAHETAAAHVLDKINAQGLSKFYQSLLAVARLLLDVQQATPENRQQAAQDALNRLEIEKINYPSLVADRALRRIYRRALRQLGESAGSPWVRLRSHLPLFAPSAPIANSRATGSSSGNPVPFWAIWIVLIFASSLVRTCGQLP